MTSQSSIGLLDSGSGTWSTVLLGLAPSGVCDQKGPIVLQKSLLDLPFLGLVHVLLVVGHDSLRDGLSDGVNLGNVATASNSYSDVQVLESLQPQQQDGLHDFDAEGLWLKQLNR